MLTARDMLVRRLREGVEFFQFLQEPRRHDRLLRLEAASIVTADDFGAAVEVNEAVERAHRDGILTAASLMVAGAAAGDAVARAKAMPSLARRAASGAGGRQAGTAGRRRCPIWWMPAGHFRTDMARAGAAMFFLPKVRAPAGGRDRGPVRRLRRHRPDAGSRQRPQAFPSASHHRRR